MVSVSMSVEVGDGREGRCIQKAGLGERHAAHRLAVLGEVKEVVLAVVGQKVAEQREQHAVLVVRQAPVHIGRPHSRIYMGLQEGAGGQPV